jgi:hypothetical protein
MDMMPAILVVVMLVLAWRWELVGTILCAGLAIFYIVMTWGKMDWIANLIIAGPLVLLSVLWLLSWLQKKKYLEEQAA